MSVTVGIIGILVACLLFFYLTFRGWSTLWNAMICSAIVIATNGLDFVEVFESGYLGGAAQMLAAIFFVVVCGAIFGTLYSDSGAAIPDLSSYGAELAYRARIRAPSIA